MLENYKVKYVSRDKYIFVPNEACELRGHQLIRRGARIEMPEYFFHYRSGGHVAALHTHLDNKFFFRIDLQNFFYSISRNRINRTLREHGIRPARSFARWSCVRNPYGLPTYVLPIGFVQSPLLASLVLMGSAVAAAIERAREREVIISVYFDDFVGSAQNEAELIDSYNDILNACREANLTANQRKLSPPAERIIAFNCNLTHGSARVTDERIAKFLAGIPTALSKKSFEEYCARVTLHNYEAGLLTNPATP
jgi:hypothetical protein